MVAHELGHVHYHDVRDGLLWVASSRPFGLFAAATLAGRLAPRDAPPGRGRSRRGAVARPAGAAVTWISNQLSRDVERRADAFSLELTTSRGRSSASSGGSPSRTWPTRTRRAGVQFLFGTHPTTLQRIGQAGGVR